MGYDFRGEACFMGMENVFEEADSLFGPENLFWQLLGKMLAEVKVFKMCFGE